MLPTPALALPVPPGSAPLAPPHPPACSPTARSDTQGPAANTRPQPSAPPAAPPSAPATAPRRSPPASPDLLLVSSDSALPDSPAGSTPHKSFADSGS